MRKITIAIMVLILTMCSCIYVWGDSNTAEAWNNECDEPESMEMSEEVQSSVNEIGELTKDMCEGLWEAIIADQN